MSLVLALFTALLLFVVAIGVPCTLDVRWIPQIVKEIYVYGKPTKPTGDKSPIVNRLVRLIQVPKSWFSHFYWLASAYTFLVLVVLFRKFIYGSNPPELVVLYINLVAFHQSHPSTNPTASILVTILFLFHSIRRLYESVCVSVYSDATMNLLHYCVGLLHYWGVITTLLAYSNIDVDFSSPDFTNRNVQHLFSIQTSVGVAIFLFASHQQNLIHRTLASYRKKPGKEDKYFLPRDGLFDYVSCPNFLCEIVIYVSLYLVLGLDHFLWAIITIWVATNQTLAALMAHKWYRSHFKDYPSGRRAIFPFLL